MNNGIMRKLNKLKIFLFVIAMASGLICAASETPKNTAKDVSKLPTMIEFGAHRCNACRKMMPVIESLQKGYAGVMKVTFVDVWIKENVGKAREYKISSIPTQVFFDAKGKELWRHTGYISEKDILAKWKTLGYDFAALKKAKTKK